MERVLQVMVWFYEHGNHKNGHGLFDLMDLEERRHPQIRYRRVEREDTESEEDEEEADMVSAIFSNVLHFLFTLWKNVLKSSVLNCSSF